MPSVSGPQQRLFAAALHEPQKLKGKYRRLTKLPKRVLREFTHKEKK